MSSGRTETLCEQRGKAVLDHAIVIESVMVTLFVLLIHRRNLISVNVSFDRKLWQLKQKEEVNCTLNHLWCTLMILSLMKAWLWKAAVMMMMVLSPRYNWQLLSVVHGNVIQNVIMSRYQPWLEHLNPVYSAVFIREFCFEMSKKKEKLKSKAS